jgi:hypothetical protein
MANPIAAVASVVTNIGGGLLQRNTARQAAAQASDAQIQGSQAGMDELRSQFANLQELLKPYVQVGPEALQGQRAIVGLGGPAEEAAQIARIEQSPLFQAQVRQGEEALLQGASATGGLRGGNIQAALAQFRPGMLQSQIDLQYERLGGLTTLGQKSAAAQAGAGMGLAESISGLYGDIGASRAGRAMAEQRAQGQFQGGLINLAGQALPAIGKMFSDIRLKENIKKIGTRPDGLGVYEFDYIWGGDRNIGLMAQEVNEVYPHAVGVVDGYLTVNYSQV